MPNRPGLLSALCVSLVLLTLTAIVQAEPASRPAESTGSFGAVQEAIQLLYVMPNPSARRFESLPSAPAKRSTPSRSQSAVESPAAQAALTPADRRALEHAQLIPPPEAESRDPALGTPPAETGIPAEEAGYITRLGPRVPQHRRDFANYRYYGGQPGGYGYGSGYSGYDVPGDWYRYDYLRWYDHQRFVDESEMRTDIVLKHFKGHLSKALTLFNRGLYREAADAFRLAANANHGDPASRLYTAHALFAIGRYQEAIPYLRRAYELQPQITYLNFNIRDDYGNKSDFDQHLKALEDALAQAPSNMDRLIMLGYVSYYSNQRDRAYQVLSSAVQIDRRDPLVNRLLENSRPADVKLDAVRR